MKAQAQPQQFSSELLPRSGFTIHGKSGAPPYDGPNADKVRANLILRCEKNVVMDQFGPQSCWVWPGQGLDEAGSD